MTISGLEQSSGLRRRMSIGTIWTTIGSAVTVVSGLGVTILLVRSMETTQYGTLATAIAASSLAGVMTGAGLSQAVPQVAARRQQLDGGDAGVLVTFGAGMRLAWSIAIIVLLTCTAAFLGYVLGGHRSELVNASLALLPVIATFPIAGVLTGTLLATFRPRALALASLLNAAVLIIGVATVIQIHRPSAVEMGVVRSVAAIVMVGWMGWYVSSVVKRLRRSTVQSGCEELGLVSLASRSVNRSLLRVGAAMALSGVFAAAVSQLDVLMVGVLGGLRASAIYQPTSRLLDVILLLLTCFAPFFLTIASSAAAKGDAGGVRLLYHWTSRWALAVTAPILSILLVSPAAVLHLLYGSAYVAPVVAARVLGLGGLVNVALGLNSLTLAALGEASLVARRLAIALAVDVIACILLVPRLGVTGGACATTATLIVANGACSVRLWHRFRIAPWSGPWIATVVSLGVSLAVAALMSRAIHSDPAQCFVTAVTAGLFVTAANLITGGRMEREGLREAARRLLHRQ